MLQSNAKLQNKSELRSLGHSIFMRDIISSDVNMDGDLVYKTN